MVAETGPRLVLSVFGKEWAVDYSWVDAMGDPPECPCGYGPEGSCAVCVSGEFWGGFEEFRRSEAKQWLGLSGTCEGCLRDWEVGLRKARAGEEWWQTASTEDETLSYDVESGVLLWRCQCGELVAVLADRSRDGEEAGRSPEPDGRRVGGRAVER